MSLTLLIIVNYFPPIVDGVGDYTLNWCKVMSEKGHKLHIICRDNNEIKSYHEKNQFGNVYPIVSNWNHFKEWMKIINLIRNIKPNWVIVQYVPYAFQKKGWPWGMALLLFLIRFFSFFKVIIFFHEVRTKINVFSIKSLITGILMWLISGVIHLLSSVSITSNIGYSRLLSLYGKKSYIIPIGSNVPVDRLDESNIIKKNNRVEDNFIISVFGFGIRSYEIILVALNNLVKVIPNLKFFAIGKYNPKFIQELKTKIISLNLQHVVIITGFIPSDQISQYLKATDIFLMLEPSSSRNTWTGTSTRSGTLATALGTGCAIIGTKGELTNLELSKCIYCIDHLTPETLTDALLKLFNDEKKRKNLKEFAFSYFQERLTWEAICNQYESILISK